MSSLKRNAPKSPTKDARLQEQVRLLTEENRRLQALLASQGLNTTFPANSNNVFDSTRPRSSTRGPTVSTTTPVTPKNNRKGCSCKGNCGTRVCGCMKNQSACGEFCRCSNTLCQNQDANKENDNENQAELTKEDEENIEKFSRLNLKDKKQLKQEKKPKGQKQSKQEVNGTPGPLNKPLEKVGKPRSIFSPDTRDNVFDFQGTEIGNISLRFGNDEAETETATNNRQSNETREEGAKKTKRPLRNAVKNREARERSKRELLQVPKVTRKLRSMSNEEVISEKLMEEKRSTKRRSMSTDGEVGVPKKLGALLSGFRPMKKRAANSRKARVDNGESEHETNVDDKKTSKKNDKNKGTIKSKERKNGAADSKGLAEAHNHVDKTAQKNKKKPVKKEKNNDTIENQNAMALAERWSNGDDSSHAHSQVRFKEMSIENENNIDPVDEQNNVENQKESESSDQSDHEIYVKTAKEEATTSEEEIVHEQSEYSETSPLNNSMRSDLGSQQNTFSPEANEDFNPMIPRRQLSRSPAQLLRSPGPRSPMNQPLETTSKRMNDPSERPLPVPLQEEPEFEPPPPEELSKDIVDWEEHKQHLVHCRKCNRTFHPHRINKHEKFCKRV